MTNFTPETKESVPVKAINEWLKNNYGSFDGMPKFRLSFANDQKEKRMGTFSDYTTEGVFIRTVTEVREVPKYPEGNFKDCYLLERMIPNYHTNIPGKLSYEAFWSYDKVLPDGSKKHPTFEAIQFIMIHTQEGPTKSAAFYIDLATKQDNDVLSYYENLFGNDEGFGFRNEVINKEFEVEH